MHRDYDRLLAFAISRENSVPIPLDESFMGSLLAHPEERLRIVNMAAIAGVDAQEPALRRKIAKVVA